MKKKILSIFLGVMAIFSGCNLNGPEVSAVASSSSIPSEPISVSDTSLPEQKYAFEVSESMNVKNVLEAVARWREFGVVYYAYDDYDETLDLSAYNSVLEIYQNEEKILFEYVGEFYDFTLAEKLLDRVRLRPDFLESDCTAWSVLDYDAEADFELYTELAAFMPEGAINEDEHYLVYAVNRKILNLSIYLGNGGDATIRPPLYMFGPQEEKPASSSTQWPPPPPVSTDYINPPDSLRCILSNEFYSHMIFIYVVGKDKNFNVMKMPPRVYWEYTQAEITVSGTEHS